MALFCINNYLLKSTMMGNKRQDYRIYGNEYHCWRKGKYIGKATWVDDNNIGDSFIRMVVNSTGELIHEVYMPDEWQFV